MFDSLMWYNIEYIFIVTCSYLYLGNVQLAKFIVCRMPKEYQDGVEYFIGFVTRHSKDNKAMRFPYKNVAMLQY